MKTIEIYDYDTNKPKFTIQTRKTKNIQDDVIKFLKDKKYSLILQGKVIPNIETNLYWLAYNKDTKESIKLWYREKENIKEKDTFDIIGLRLSKEQRQQLKDLGYNTYDIGSDSFNEPDYVSNRIIINHIGTLITTRDLHLNNYDYVDLDKAINGCEEKWKGTVNMEALIIILILVLLFLYCACNISSYYSRQEEKQNNERTGKHE